jgi:hypothetical protein
MSNLILDASVVVCRGLARRLGLRVSGRRNALGKIMNPRTCEWQSGTALAFAACFRDNSHTAPNYRVPLLQTTHNDARCRQKACAVQLSVNLSADSGTGTDETASVSRKKCTDRFLKILAKIAQRAQREATGYYCGYTFKAQPVGAKYLRAAAESLNYMDVGLKDKTAGQQWHVATHRILTEFQYRCTSRTAPEEVNLCSGWHDQDPTNAEFVRTYMSTDFPGQNLLVRLEKVEKEVRAADEIRKVVPTNAKAGAGPHSELKHFPDHYGFRGPDPLVRSLNPWEFLMLWEVKSLPEPRKDETGKEDKVALSKWLPDGSDYVVNACTENKDYESHPDRLLNTLEPPTILFFPDNGDHGPALRNRWYMQRRLRPMVPAPIHTPLPTKKSTREEKAWLFQCI